MTEETVPWWMAGSLAAFWIARETWGALLSRRKERTETDANVDLLNGLVERVKTLESSLTDMSKRLEDEVRLRMQAQEEAHKLRLRVMTLESAMRQVGAVIPPESQL